MLASPDPRDLGQLLADSDTAYFQAGAAATQFHGGVVYHVPGLEHLPSGCIVVPDLSRALSADFTAAARAAVAAVGAPLLRFYTNGRERGRKRLGDVGLGWRIEAALALRLRDAAGFLDTHPSLRIREVSDADWGAKAELAASLESLPDGSRSAAPDWTLLERRKWEAGHLRFWIAEMNGVPCGSFGLADHGELYRLKNLAVHPALRRQGVGRALVAHAGRVAAHEGAVWMGVYGLKGGAGTQLYLRCGFQHVGEQTEWTLAIERVRETSTAGASHC